MIAALVFIVLYFKWLTGRDREEHFVLALLGGAKLPVSEGNADVCPGIQFVPIGRQQRPA